LLVPGAAPMPATPAWWWSRIVVYALTLALVFVLSLLLGRWEVPRRRGVTPPAGIVAACAVLAFLPPLGVLQLFLDLPLAVFGVICLTIAVLALDRWPASFVPNQPKSTSAPTSPGPSPASPAPVADAAVSAPAAPDA